MSRPLTARSTAADEQPDVAATTGTIVPGVRMPFRPLLCRAMFSGATRRMGGSHQRTTTHTGVDMGRSTDVPSLERFRRDEAGEGVISTAIAVLIMALIGAAMWLVFSDVFDDASDSIRDEVGRIGDP